jgi:hypothetical protein
VLVVVLWLCVIAYQYFVNRLSGAGNVKYCYEFHAGSGLRFAIRLQEDGWIVPTRALGWATDPRKWGLNVLVPTTLDHEHLWRFFLASLAQKRCAGKTCRFKISRASIRRSIMIPRNTWFYNTQTHSIVGTSRHTVCLRIRKSRISCYKMASRAKNLLLPEARTLAIEEFKYALESWRQTLAFVRVPVA